MEYVWYKPEADEIYIVDVGFHTLLLASYNSVNLCLYALDKTYDGPIPLGEL